MVEQLLVVTLIPLSIVLIRCAVWCVLSVRFGEFQCIFYLTKHQKLTTLSLPSGQPCFILVLQGIGRSPNQYGALGTSIPTGEIAPSDIHELAFFKHFMSVHMRTH